MADSGKQPATQPPPKDTSWRLAWVVGTIAILVIGWSVLSPRLPGTPFTLKRNALGRLVPVTTDGTGRLPRVSTSLDAASISASNSVSSTHSSTHAANSGFACRRVAILNASAHPLLEQIGSALPEQLSQLAFIDNVAYLPANSALPRGQRSPDLWITLDLGNLKTSGMLPRLTVDAQIKATAGSTLAAGHYGRTDPTSPPIVENHWQGTIEHKSTITGFSTDKYSLVAKNITESLANQLTTHLNKLHEDFGSVPEFNEDFYPAYTPTPAEVTFDHWGAQHLASSHGLMFSNETFWRVKTTDPVPAMLAAARDRFQESGWKLQHFNETDRQPYLALSLDEDRLNIFSPRDDAPRSHVTIRIDGEAAARPPEPKTIIVQYVNRLSRGQLEKAIDRQLDQGGPLDSLLALSRNLNYGQRARYLTALEELSANSPRAWRSLAQEYSNSKQNDKARAALRRAHWLAKIDPASHDQLDKTKKLAKKLKVEDILKEKLSPELFEEFGLAELKEGQFTPPIEVALNQPAFFYAMDQNGKWHVLNWRIKSTGNPADGQRYQVSQGQTSARGNSSWGGGQLLSPSKIKREQQGIPDLGTVTVTIEVLPDDRFRFIGTIEPT